MNAKKLMTYLEITLTTIWKGKKFDDMSDVHSEVRDTINVIIAEHGLRFDYWSISDKNYNRVIKVTPIYREDKRSKYKVKGTMIAMTFEPLVAIEDHATIEDLVNAKRKEEVISNIERLERQIEQERKELQESEQGLLELKNELKTFS